MRDVFVHSLNTGMVQLLRFTGSGGDRITGEAKEKLYDYYVNRFRLGQKTGIGVYEEPGILLKPDMPGSTVQYATMTFGQGMTANMLQIATGVAAAVNGGVYHAPYIEMGKGSQGERILSEQTSEQMRSVMVDAWQYLNKRNLRPYVSIGGKTGTAEVPLDTGGYKEGEYIGDFVGYVGATADRPEYVIMVRIGGKGKEMGGWNHAGPMFNEIVDFMVKYERIGV